MTSRFSPPSPCSRVTETGTISPREVTQAVLERIDVVNSPLNAFVTVSADLAMDQATAAERAYSAGGAPGPLAGVPYSIKDLTPTKGVRTARGSLLDPDWIPDYDAPHRLPDGGGRWRPARQDQHARAWLERGLGRTRPSALPTTRGDMGGPPVGRAAERERRWLPALARLLKAATGQGQFGFPPLSAGSLGSSRPSAWSRNTRPAPSATSPTWGRLRVPVQRGHHARCGRR